jgi:beta-lactam-binding protein with PASTA domain
LFFLRWIGYAILFGIGVVAGTALLVLVSFAGTETTVPPVEGLTLEKAEFQAGRARLRFMVEDERYDLKVETGYVITQKPEAGSQTRRGRILSVVASKGIDRMAMPDFRGDRMDQAQLKARQSQLKLVSIGYVHHPSEAQTVVSQYPQAESTIPKETEISLLVSLGPRPVTYVMPALAGFPLPTARDRLQRYGIQMGAARILRDPGRASGTILSQNPPAGTPLEEKDVIQVSVSRP